MISNDIKSWQEYSKDIQENMDERDAKISSFDHNNRCLRIETMFMKDTVIVEVKDIMVKIFKVNDCTDKK